MKGVFIFILASFVFSNLYSQDYLDDIANKSCDCCSKISDTVSYEMMSMQLGLCMIDAAMPYKKKLKKEFNIDLDRLDESAEQLGSFVVIRMMNVCPDMIMYYMEMLNTQQTEDIPPIEVDFNRVTGTITAIETDFFVTFSLKDDAGKINKFYWFSYLNSGFDLIAEYKNLIGDSVEITYDYIELFDPRINEYRQYRVIQTIDLTNFSY